LKDLLIRLAKYTIDLSKQKKSIYCRINLNWIDVSDVKDMSCLFAWTIFNGNISLWDVRNAVDMHRMFSQSAFNGNISNWDVRNVKNMEEMFENSKFEGDISKWKLNGQVKCKNIFDRCWILNCHKPEALQVVCEGFDVNDMGNDMTNIVTATKQAVGKHSKIYNELREFINANCPVKDIKALARTISEDEYEMLKDINDDYADIDPDIRRIIDENAFRDTLEHLVMYCYMNRMLERMDGTHESRATDEDISFVEKYIQTIKSTEHPLYGYCKMKGRRYL